MSSRPTFNLLRAAFLLLALVILVELAMTVMAGAGCFWMIIVTREYRIGACESIGQQIREVWAEMLAAILALLLAGRSPPPDEPPPPR